MAEKDIHNALDELKTYHDINSSSHDSWSSDYFRSHETYYKEIYKYISEYMTGKLLEVGSAPFHMTTVVDKCGYDIIGLDLQPERMEALIEKFDLDVKQCDIERDKFPVDDDSVDGVIFTEVLEHLRINPLWTLDEINRVLKPGGKLLLSTPNLLSIYNIHSLLTKGKITDPFEEFNKLRTVGHMGHVREYTPAEVCSLLENTGFEVLSTHLESWQTDYFPVRSITHNLGIIAAKLFPVLRKLQLHIATVDQ